MRQHRKLDCIDFLRESDRIEGIRAPITEAKKRNFMLFLSGSLTLESVCAYQATVAPGKPIRDRIGMNVSVGNYVAPRGGRNIIIDLMTLLAKIDRAWKSEWHLFQPWHAHCDFEALHPFMDGNGRTGRAIWAWHMLKIGQDPFALGFLHTFYYQTLTNTDRA